MTTKKEIEASDKLPSLVDASADWVELKWYKFNFELRTAFFAGIKYQKEIEQKKNLKIKK